ncbi:hypothetical protein Ahy_A08g038942 [Arachis hypogaea]|uniref:Uncharacterized protein n=1 Tax=Arachis hypogaea TaxID=3818 RepID=A0A445BUR8_ARAHY|nr:hypothetical protein Ahy_A08g038942 [Arachis hypogaea]
MAVNFMTRFKSAEGKRYLINAAYSPSKAGYEWYMDALRGVSPAMVDWAGRFRKEIWLQHCDSGRRFGHMTTNLSECINAVLKGTRPAQQSPKIMPYTPRSLGEAVATIRAPGCWTCLSIDTLNQ